MPRTIGQAVGFLVGVWLAIVLVQPLGTAAYAATTTGRAGSLEAGLAQSVNAVRTANGLVPLVRDAALDAVARAHSADMAARHYLAHETPEGLNPPARVARAGITGISLLGENVGTTSRGDPNREIVDAWLASPVHRANLLAPAFNATGVGIARAADGSYYYTQLYATRPR
jgi:uncharacterized protein YkwD